MGKIDGFLEYSRKYETMIEPLKRIETYNEFHIPLTKEERELQGARCMDCGIPFCQYGQEIAGMTSGCPLNNMIPEWNDLIFKGNYEAALKRLLKTDPFPEFTSRVCPSPCEKACTCSLNGDAVTICENEKAIIEYGFEHGLMQSQTSSEKTSKKIAIVGSGPSGLAAAWMLNQRGHQVDVFERSDQVGGLLMYGIPNMKLDKAVVKRRIDLMKEEGISFHVNEDISTELQASNLIKEYDSVLLACGASNPRDISVEGRDASDVHFAVDFLSESTKALLHAKDKKSLLSASNKHVLVIGGGDTGNDCVGTSIRQGCASVVQLEMMPKPPMRRLDSNPWPEWPKIAKTDYGQEEAIAVFGKDPRLYQTTLKELIKDSDGKVKQAKLVELEWVEDTETKRMMMREVKDSEMIIDCDFVLIAAGFLGVQANIANAFKVELNERTVIQTDAFQTNVEKIFSCGDARRGQSLVVWAIREGMDAARAIDTYLMGYSNI